MKHPGIVSLVTLAVSAALSGCGGGGGGDKAVTSMTATAIDGYLQNALVWLDVMIPRMNRTPVPAPTARRHWMSVP